SAKRSRYTTQTRRAGLPANLAALAARAPRFPDEILVARPCSTCPFRGSDPIWAWTNGAAERRALLSNWNCRRHHTLRRRRRRARKLFWEMLRVRVRFWAQN